MRLEDSLTDVLVKMSEGNPGGLSVLMALLGNVPRIDPVAIMGGMLYILYFDDLGLYGSRIWTLYKYACGQEIAGVVTLLRAHQLGHIPKAELLRIAEEGKPCDWKALVPLIQKDVPEFSA